LAELREGLLEAQKEFRLARALDDEIAIRLAWDRLRKELAAWRGATGFLP
jgi:hypothetical protein